MPAVARRTSQSYTGAEAETNEYTVVRALATPSLPIIWVGEKTPPRVVAAGRLWTLTMRRRFVAEDDAESRIEVVSRPLEVLLRLPRGKYLIPKPGKTYIVVGGVYPPRVLRLLMWGFGSLDVDEDEIEGAFKPWLGRWRRAGGRLVAVKPRGAGDAGFVLLGEAPDSKNVFREVELPLKRGVVHVFHEPTMHGFPPAEVFMGRTVKKWED